MNDTNLASFTDLLDDEIANSQESQPFSISSQNSQLVDDVVHKTGGFFPRDSGMQEISRPAKGTGQYGQFRSIDEIDAKYRSVFSYPFFNLVQSSIIDDALYSDKSMVVCAPTGSGKTVVFEMAIVQLLMELEDEQYTDDFKIIYMAPVKALCTERLTEWYPKFTKFGLLCIEVTGDTDVDFSQLKPYRIIITTPEKWDMVTRRWREHSQLVEVIKLFLIDEVHILNDEARGPVLEAVVSRMKTIELSAQSAHRIEKLQNQYQGTELTCKETPPKIRFVAVSATVGNPGDVAAWLGSAEKPAVYYKFGDECRPVKLKRIVEGYPCPEGTSIFKFDIILNYKLWPVIQKYHDGKPTLIFCNTRKSVQLTAETLSRELTVSFSPEQKAKLTALASTIKNKKLQMLILGGVGCHHAGLLYEERTNIEHAFRNRDLPILITTTTLAMGVNLPAHLVIVKNTQQYVNGAYQEYSISTILQMVGRAGRPQFDTEATAVIMTRLCDKARYQALVGGSEPLQSYLHKRLAENLNSEAALGTVNDVAQCVQWVRSTFLNVRAARDPKRYLGLLPTAPQELISKKIEELCVKAMNSLASSGLITMDEACCIQSTEAGRLMSVFYLDLETMKHIMKISGEETLERLLWIICESHELADMHLRVDERRCLNTLNRNNAAVTIRYPMKGKISTRQMKLNCIIQAILGCLNIPDPSLNQEAMKVMRIADRVCKCLVAYVTRPALISQHPKYYNAVLNSLILAKCITAHLWENSPYVSKQLKGIGPTFSTLLATAGKVNFLLLEESHPRDLERIMNKGPPAGNVVRKQVSLLPKYQLTVTPIDETSVTVQLTLLNQNYLSENMEQLTAGDNHKCYLLVGDTENNLLLLTFFKDKDLIRVYDGIITHQIKRKLSFEHKVFVHCISSSYVGIDSNSEYLFKDLETLYSSSNGTNTTADFVRKPVTKQTYITDTFKERKRKNASENDVTQSKEKKKRDNALLEKLKSLKESFGKMSEEIKKESNKSPTMSNKILQEFTLNKGTFPEMVLEPLHKKARLESPTKYLNNCPVIDITDTNSTKQMYSDEKSEMEHEQINNLLLDIENEMLKNNAVMDIPPVDLGVTKSTQYEQNHAPAPSSMYIPARNNELFSETNIAQTILNNTKKLSKNNRKTKCNYDLLNKNIDLSDEEENLADNDNNLFSDTIKSNIDKYLQQTTNTKKALNSPAIELLFVGKENKKEERNEDTFDVTSKIESEVDNPSANSPISKVCIKLYTPRSQNCINYDEITEENSVANNPVMLQNFKTNHITAETITKDCVIEELHRCLDFQASTTEIMSQTRSSNGNFKVESDVKIVNTDAFGSNVCKKINIFPSQSIFDLEQISEGRSPASKTEKTESTKKMSQSSEVNPINVKNENKTCVMEVPKKFLDYHTKRNVSQTECSNGNSRIESEIKNISPNASVSKVCEKIKQNNNNLDYEQMTKNASNADTMNEEAIITKRFSQNLGVNQTNREIMIKNCVIAVPKRSSDENLSPNQPLGPLKIETAFVHDNQNQNMPQQCTAGLHEHFNVLLEKKQEKNYSTTHLIPLTQNTLEFDSLPFPVPRMTKHPSEFPDSVEIERQTIYQNNPEDCMTHIGQNQVELHNSKPEQYTAMSQGRQNYNYPKPHNNNLYVNQYSYSATKIDVTTGENDVTVIRKIKMDVDITEISGQKSNISQHDIKNSTKDKNENKCTEISVFSPHIKFNKAYNTRQDRQDIHSNNKLIYSTEFEMKCKEFGSIASHLNGEKCNNIIMVYDKKSSINSTKQDVENCIDENKLASIYFKIPDYYSKNEKNNTTLISHNYKDEMTRIDIQDKTDKSNGDITEPMGIYPAILSSKLITQSSFDPQIKQTNSDDVEKISNNKNTTPKKESNRIGSILKKYSLILRKDNAENPNQTLPQYKTMENYSKTASTKKPKRPFKITEIQNLSTPLSKLCETVKRENLNETLNATPNHTNMSGIQIYQELNKECTYTPNDNILNLPGIKERRINEICGEFAVYKEDTVNKIDEDLTEFKQQDAAIDELETFTETDFNIDQSMFNPKTLLQRFSEEDDLENDIVVPPPPEFCDEPEFTSQEDITVPVNCYESTNWDNFYNNPNKNIFDDSNIKLTPGNEIETWTLSRHNEDVQNDSTYSTASRQSFTTIHTPRQQDTPSHNVFVSRRKLLAQFKYNRKKILPKL